MTTSSLTIWLDADLKRGAAEVADYYGLDLSSVTRAFYKQMVNTRRILLTFAPPRSRTRRALRQLPRGARFLHPELGALRPWLRPD